MQRKHVSDRFLHADLDGLDNVHQVAKFTLRGASDAAEALAAFAMGNKSVVVGGRSVGAVLENEIQKSAGGDIRFAVQVTSRGDWQLLSKNVVHGAQIAAHQSRSGGGLYIDEIALQDMAPRNLGEARKSDQGETFVKSGGTRHTMTIGRGGSSAGGLSTTEFMDMVKGIKKTSESNRDHLMHAHGHLEKVGEHLTAAKARYPFDNNVRGAVTSHEAAIECLKKIDLPQGDTDVPSLPNRSGNRPEPADADERGHETYPGPVGRFGGSINHDGAGPRVTATEPERKMNRMEAQDAFQKAYGRARVTGRRSVTFRR